MQRILYDICEKCQHFMTTCDPNNSELTLSLLLDQFDTLVVRASELT